MPDLVQPLSYLLPMTYYLTIVRGITLKELALVDMWQPAAVLFAFAAVLVTVSVKRFSKTMD